MSSSAKEPQKQVTVSVRTEVERLREDIYRPDMEKFRLFTQMLRTNALYKRAKVNHK